eukprot:COSAG02_NODE_1307_length_13340_cov_84.665282_4_plen_84_part_00
MRLCGDASFSLVNICAQSVHEVPKTDCAQVLSFTAIPNARNGASETSVAPRECHLDAQWFVILTAEPRAAPVFRNQSNFLMTE